MAGKYWEEETPEVFEFGKNQFKYYAKAGKLQVYPIVASSPNGIGRGAVIDLSSMSVDEVAQLKTVITGIFDDTMEDELS